MLDGVKTHIIQKKIRKIVKPYSVQCSFSNVSKLVTKEKEDVKREIQNVGYMERNYLNTMVKQSEPK